MRYTILLLSLLLFHFKNTAQQLPVPRNINSTYEKGTRSKDGMPGRNYWQNAADYNLKINFDPATRLISGSEDIAYTNNSPDTLRSIYFKLYPNFYKKGSIRNTPVKAEDLTDGVNISSIKLNNTVIDKNTTRIIGTNMILQQLSVAPKQIIHFSISWSYTLNKTSHQRTGEIDPGADFVAYFFPRIAVYDDIDGWNEYQYNGMQEFYNDFCHFKAAITVPNDQLVWATGNLLNAKDVLNEKMYQRLQQAEKKDSITIIVDTTEIKNSTNHTAPTNTWLYQADDVTDFVFACSDHYTWYSTSVEVDKNTGRRTRVDAAFNPVHKDYFTVISDARKTVEAMSFDFPKWPFPYPHETVFDGLDQMEYPMMVNDNPIADHAESIELTDHEIFHTMFPFYMGINETKYGWMDEGWATIGEWILSPIIDTAITDTYAISNYEKNAGNEMDAPIISLSTQLSTAYSTNSYGKPAMGYLYVKDMLGDELFYKGLHYYIQQWHGKHPMPLDFFNCMNTGSGKNLNWFWKKWFYEDGFPDLAISKFTEKRNEKKIVVEMIGNKPVPVSITVHFTDGSIKKIHRSVAVWENGNKTTTIQFTDPKKITEAILEDPHVPDVNRKNNVWKLSEKK